MIHEKAYADVVFDDASSVIEVSDRSSFRGSYEYAGDRLEIGFTTNDGVKVDFLAKRTAETEFKGKVYVQRAQGRRTPTG